MSLSDAPEVEEPEEEAPPTLAEPATGTIETLWAHVEGAECVHCEEVIWRGPGWDWEHIDTDEPACALPSDEWVAELRSKVTNPTQEEQKDHEEMVRLESDIQPSRDRRSVRGRRRADES